MVPLLLLGQPELFLEMLPLPAFLGQLVLQVLHLQLHPVLFVLCGGGGRERGYVCVCE